jgi:ATP-dependent DNA helicase RecG
MRDEGDDRGMSSEGQTFERKSIRYALGKAAGLEKLAEDCVGLANAVGGVIHLGIEDDALEPPVEQRLATDLPDQVRKRLPQITVNVGVDVRRCTANNGGEYLEIQVFRSEGGIASTSDGRYFLRVSDETRRLLPDDLGRLWADRNSFVWELQVRPDVAVAQLDAAKRDAFCTAIRASDRVSAFVKGKSDAEILEHYLFVKNGCLTNLGALWVGRREDRAALQHAPVIQCLKFDESGKRVRKWAWDDYSLNPLEMIEAVWREVPEWQESYELPDGLFRTRVPHYDEAIVRELLVNALVHRPYTTGGDVFINLYPGRMEVHNPGLLPIGVTPSNILHVSSQRNPHLARVAVDLKMMEREGSGFDRMYELLLASGRPAPVVTEGNDRVVVTVQKKILRPEILDFMAKIEREYQPTQKEIIALGLLAQGESMTGAQLARALELDSAEQLKPWTGRLREWGVLRPHGRTKGAEYRIDPAILRRTAFKGGTSLKRIEDHRLRELILQDLAIYENASRSEIHGRIGPEIAITKLRRVLGKMVAEGLLAPQGERRGRRYLLIKTPEITD